jgi:cysteine desulfurase
LLKSRKPFYSESEYELKAVYLDWAATAPPEADLLAGAAEIAARYYANPSSPHAAGRQAAELLADCRRRLAACLGCAPEELVFTSGGTEANNLVLFSLLLRAGGRRVVLSGLEHDSLFQAARRLQGLGGLAAIVPAGAGGRVDPERVLAAVDSSTALVALMLVNNETGALQPVAEVARGLARLSREGGRRVLLHTDAVQAFGKVPFRPAELGVDCAALSAHKIGGPRGVGALYLRRPGPRDFLNAGGGQEAGRRAGTENLAGAWALAEAGQRAVGALAERLSRARSLMGGLLAGLRALGSCRILPEGRGAGLAEELFSPYILAAAFPTVPGEVLVRVMQEEGFLISTGAACSSRKKERTRVLEAGGVPRELAASSVRISIGPQTTEAELQGLLEALRRRLPGL